MDIERVNENTFKMHLTYHDIEKRGYTREDIWYNRSKGEQLFWDMMEEVNTDDYFDVEGPIWIHVNASEEGLEVVVTRVNMAKEIEKLLGTPTANEATDNDQNNYDMDDLPDNELLEHLRNLDDLEDEDVPFIPTHFIFTFKDIDELIPVAAHFVNDALKTALYEFEAAYYLVVDFSDEKSINYIDKTAIIQEYLQPSRITVHRLEEYGTPIMASECLETVRKYFLPELAKQEAANKEELQTFEAQIAAELTPFLQQYDEQADVLNDIIARYIMKAKPATRKPELIAAGAVRYAVDAKLFATVKLTVKQIAEHFDVSTSSITKYAKAIAEYQ